MKQQIKKIRTDAKDEEVLHLIVGTSTIITLGEMREHRAELEQAIKALVDNFQRRSLVKVTELVKDTTKDSYTAMVIL